MSQHIVEMQLWHLKQITLQMFAINGSSIAHPSHILYGACILSFLKASEVGRSLHIAVAFGRFHINVESSIVHLECYWLSHSLYRHFWIVLRTPCHQVVAISSCKTWSIIIHSPHRTPCTIVGMHHIRVVHSLLLSPLRIVRRAKLPNMLPSLFFVEVSHV